MEERKKKRFSALSLIRIIALVVALVSAGAILWQLYIYRQGEETYEELRQQYTTTAEESAQSQAEEQAEEPFQLLDVDFEALQAQNPDVVGWIDFDAIELSYPVVWSGDNEKYLRTIYTKAISKICSNRYKFATSFFALFDNYTFFNYRLYISR